MVAAEMREEAPLLFDGNEHDEEVYWLVMTAVEEFADGALDDLMRATIVDDNLTWMILPTNGFRL